MGLIYAEFSSPVDDGTDVNSVSFSTRTTPAAGGAPRQAQVHDCHLSMDQNSVSQSLYNCCLSGKNIPSGTIGFYESESSEYAYLTYLMTDIMVVSVSFGSNSSAQIGLNFKTVKVSYAH